MLQKTAIKYFKSNQEEFRKNLFDYWMTNPTSNKKMAQDIGIAELTLRKFLHKAEDVNTVSMIKIKNYLDRKEFSEKDTIQK